MSASPAPPALERPEPETIAGPLRDARPRRTPGLLRAVGVFLIAVPFVPLTRLFGEVQGDGFLATPAEWLMGLLIFGVAAWLLARLWAVAARRTGGPRGEAVRAERQAMAASGSSRRRRALPPMVSIAPAILALAVLLVIASAFAFRRHPLLVDAVVQLFQARIFAAGAVAAPAPPLPAFFLTQHMLVDGGAWYSQYPPGHSALLALGVLAGAPWLVGILLSLGTALFLASFTRRVYGAPASFLVAGLLVACPFFWFMGASFMNHVSALFFIAGFLNAFTVWETSRRPVWAMVAGLALGAGCLSRPLECLAVGAAFTGFALAARGPRTASALLAGTAGLALTGSVYLVYNALTTGDPFLAGYVKLWGDGHGLGFHETPWGELHTPLTGLRNELVDLGLLNVFLFEWPIPALLPVGAFFAAGWGRRRWDLRLLVAFLAIPAIYFFYWHRDAFLGPRFLYGGLAFLLPLCARALLEGVRRLRRRRLGGGRLLGPVNAGVFAAALVGLSFAYAAVYAIPQRFRVYATSLASMKRDVVAEARAAGMNEGLIFVTESWGSRLLARARALGVPAALAEKAYRRVDHCRFAELVGAAERLPRSGVGLAHGAGTELARDLERLLAEEAAVVQVALNGDPTLRLEPGGRLTELCVDELRYDGPGFDLFTPHLPENVPELRRPFVVARDLRSTNAELESLYPGLPAYLYREGRFSKLR